MPSLKKLIDKEKREYTFAQTFHGYARHVDLLLLAANASTRQRRQIDRRAAAADGREHARRHMDGLPSASPGQPRIYDKIALPPSPRRTLEDHPEKCWDERRIRAEEPIRRAQ